MDKVSSGGAKRLRDEDEAEYIQVLQDNNVVDDIPSGGAKRRRDEDETEYIQELHDNNVVDDVHSTLPLMACVILDVSSSQPHMNSPMVRSSIIFQTLGSTQHTPWMSLHHNHEYIVLWLVPHSSSRP